MSKINTLPKGLQSFLGNTSQGVNPSDLSPGVDPSFDMYPFWASDKIKGAFVNANTVGVIGQNLNLAVPEGEVWQLIAVSSTFPMLVENSVGLGIQLVEPSGSVNVTIASVFRESPDSITNCVVSKVFPNRFLLPAGWKIRGVIESASDATGRAMFVSAMYIPFKT